MKRVLDSCVAFKWVVPETHSDKALRLRDAFRNALVELLAPDVFPVEVMHGLTKAERQGRLSVSQGGISWADVMTTCPLLCPSIPLIPRAYKIASQAHIGIYDCLYVALAEQEGCELVTSDTRLLNSLQGQFPFIVDLATLP